MTTDHTHRPPPDDDRVVERLVRLADHGPGIPADGARRVKHAIRPMWKAEVRARRRSRRLRAATTVAAAAALAVAVTAVLRSDGDAPRPPAVAATLAAVTGTLTITPPGGSVPGVASDRVGATLPPGTWLRTGDADRAALELAGGESLRIDHGTRLRIASARTLELDRGAVYVDTHDLGEDGGIEVRTRLGVARDIGTQFEVRRPDGKLVVRVREGRVAVDRDGEEIVVHQGTGVAVASDGSRSALAVRADGPEWIWTQEIAPPFTIEGRTALAYLDWVSNETGLWIRFADEEIERLASSTVLHGSIGGLSPAESLDVVLPGCGLEARRAPGAIVVGRTGGLPPDR